MDKLQKAPQVIPCFGQEGCFLIDREGSGVVDTRFARIFTFVQAPGGGYIAAAQTLEGSWGYINEGGQWVVAPLLEEARSFTEDGLSRFKRNGLWGYLDTSGQVAIEPQFPEGLPFSAGFAAVRTGKAGDLYGYIDTKGDLVIPESFKEPGDFSSVGLAAIHFPGLDAYGYIDTKGETVIKPTFSHARLFSKGGVAPVELDGLWGLIDRRGKWITKPTYRRMHEFGDEGLAYFDLDYDHAGYINEQGKEILRGAGLSETMSWGLVRGSTDYFSPSCYYDKNGKVGIPGDYWVGQAFHPCGATLAMKEAENPDEDGYCWGVLQANGDFIELPAYEPLLDANNALIGFDHSTGTAPFLAEDGSVVYVDGQGKALCRFRQEQTPQGSRVVLLNGSNERLWEGQISEGVDFPTPFFRRSPQEHFLDLPYWQEDIADLALKMLAAPPRPFVPYSSVYDPKRKNVYNLAGLDNNELDGIQTGRMAVLAHRYLDEETNSGYGFLSGREYACFQRYRLALRERLSARFGQPEENREIFARDIRRSVWQVDDKCLILQFNENTGDGDCEFQLWLTAGTREGLLPSEEEVSWEDGEDEEQAVEEKGEPQEAFDQDRYDRLMNQAEEAVDEEAYEQVIAIMGEVKVLLDRSKDVEVQDLSRYYEYIIFSLDQLGRKEEALALCRKAIRAIRAHALFPYLEDHNPPRYVLRACYDMLACETLQQGTNSRDVERAWHYIKTCFAIFSPIEDPEVLEPFYETKVLVLLKRSEYKPEERWRVYYALYRMEQANADLVQENPRIATLAASEEYKAFLADMENGDNIGVND